MFTNINNNQKVCIIIVTDNNYHTIENALNSATLGLKKPDQVIIGDNDSKDQTYEKVCQLLKAEKIKVEDKQGWPPKFETIFNDVPITIFRQRKSTKANALNICIKMAKSDSTIFGFLNATDTYNMDKIFRSAQIFNMFPHVLCVVSDCDLSYKDGRCIRTFRSSPTIKNLINTYSYDSNFFVSKSAFAKMQRGFNETVSLMEDYELLLRIAKIGLIYHIAEPLHTHVINDNLIEEKTKIANEIKQMIISEINNAQKA